MLAPASRRGDLHGAVIVITMPASPGLAAASPVALIGNMGPGTGAPIVHIATDGTALYASASITYDGLTPIITNIVPR